MSEYDPEVLYDASLSDDTILEIHECRYSYSFGAHEKESASGPYDRESYERNKLRLLGQYLIGGHKGRVNIQVDERQPLQKEILGVGYLNLFHHVEAQITLPRDVILALPGFISNEGVREMFLQTEDWERPTQLLIKSVSFMKSTVFCRPLPR